jgi:hypothetical protein
MIVRLFGAAALSLVAAAAPAAAQSTGNVAITGEVGVRCEFTVNSDLIALGELSVSGAAGGQLDTSQVNGESAQLVGWCNGASSSMTVEADPIVNVAPAPAGFENTVNYTATATIGAGPSSASDSSAIVGAGAPGAVGIFSNTINVVLSGSSTPGGGKLVAGAYNGSVDVTLTPAL